MLNLKYPIFPSDSHLLSSLNEPQAKRMRFLKEKIHSHLPVGFRSFLYFIYRYFIKFGFLDGSNGFIWLFMQDFWYRLLVDMKIKEVETLSKGNVESMKNIIRERFGLKN